MSKTILAIDPSLTNTAVVIGDRDKYTVKCFGSKPSGDDPVLRIVRAANLVREICEYATRFSPLAAAYIEGYSFGSNDSRARYSAEYGGLLRAMLIEQCSLNVREVAPTTIKKFITGTGKGKKLGMVAHVVKKFAQTFETDDEYDAYGLYRLGLVAEGIEEPQNQAQAEAVATVLGKANTPKRKKKAS